MSREEEIREKEIAQTAESEYFVTKAEEFAWMHGAQWADKNPRKGLWDAEKVINFLKKRATLENSSNINIYMNGATYHSVNDFIEDLQKAMED